MIACTSLDPEAGFDASAPVMPYGTIVCVRRGRALVSAIEGDLDPRARPRCEAAAFGRLTKAGITFLHPEITPGDIRFEVAAGETPEVRRVLSGLNLALRIDTRCATIEVSAPFATRRPSLECVLDALAAADVAPIRCADRGATLEMLVRETDASAAAAVLRAL